MDMENALSYSRRTGGETCISSVLGELIGKMMNLKNELINLIDEIIKMKAARDRELEKQTEGKMMNATMPEKNRNKSIVIENDDSEIKIN